MKLCPVCNKEPAINHSIYGILPCNNCTSRRSSKFTLPNVQVEMVGSNIKEQRKEYAKSAIQPFRSGILSKEYLDAYGTKNIKASKKDIKNAKYVWGDVTSSNLEIAKTK